VQRSSKIPRATANDFGATHACLQFLASPNGAELEIRRSKTAATANLGGEQDYLKHAAVLPSGRLIQ
jgi:hypothetical protein